MPLKARRMKGLRIDEASGVDAPAHLSPGWMVIKSAGGADPVADLSDEQIEALIKATEADEQGDGVDELIQTLTKALGSMPAATKAQATALIGALGGDAGGADAGDDPVAKAVADALTKANTDRDAAVTKATELEAELAKAKGAPAGETEEEALAKAVATMPEPMQKAWAAQQAIVVKAQADATAANTKAEVEHDARVSGEYLAKARGADYTGLPTKAETLGTVLREVDEKLTKEAGAELHRLLKAASHAVATGGADFAQFGGTGADVTGATGAMSALEKAAEDIQTADPTIDRATALIKAADASPDLARAYQEGQG